MWGWFRNKKGTVIYLLADGRSLWVLFVLINYLIYILFFFPFLQTSQIGGQSRNLPQPSGTSLPHAPFADEHRHLHFRLHRLGQSGSGRGQRTGVI